MTTLVANGFRDLPVTRGCGLPDPRDQVSAGDVAGLAALLGDVELATASNVELLAGIVGWARVEAMAVAAQARAIDELAARPGVGAARVVDELQAALSCTAYQAQRTVLRALDLATQPAVGDALRCGDVDVRKADAILENLPRGGDPQRWAGVVHVVLDEAAWLSVPALKRRTAALVIATDPAQAAARCARARQSRAVSLRQFEDSMALFTAYVPAPDAVAAFTVIDALAGTHRSADDDLTVDQRRADEFGRLFGQILATGTLPDGRSLPRKHGRRPEIQVTVAATTLLGLDDLPGELAGHGPIPADLARRIAADGTWRRLLTDPVTGRLLERGDATYRPGADLTGTVIARDVTCDYMGCGQPAWRCELDHREPFDPYRPADEQTTAENLDARCKHHHELKTHGGWTVRRVSGSGASEWTDPWGVTFTRLAIPITITAAVLERCTARADRRDRADGGDRAGNGDATGPPGTGAAGYPDEPPF